MSLTITKPVVGGNVGTWGGVLNTALDAIVTFANAAKLVADAALAKVGGVMTGRVDLHTATIKMVAKGAISGAQSLDISTGQYFTMEITGATELSFTNVPTGTFATAIILRILTGGTDITWPASVHWEGGSAPELSALGTDLIGLITDDNGTIWRGIVLAQDLS